MCEQNDCRAQFTPLTKYLRWSSTAFAVDNSDFVSLLISVSLQLESLIDCSVNFCFVCGNAVSSIIWGKLEKGKTKQRTVFVNYYLFQVMQGDVVSVWICSEWFVLIVCCVLASHVRFHLVSTENDFITLLEYQTPKWVYLMIYSCRHSFMFILCRLMWCIDCYFGLFLIWLIVFHLTEREKEVKNIIIMN